MLIVDSRQLKVKNEPAGNMCAEVHRLPPIESYQKIVLVAVPNLEYAGGRCSVLTPTGLATVFGALAPRGRVALA
jgi:hypothetical protein